MKLTLAVTFASLGISVWLGVAWLIQLRTRNGGWVDSLWSFGLGFLGVFYAIVGSAPTPLRVLLAILAGGWGLRLGAHLYGRSWSEAEDARYRRLRDAWGSDAARRMFWFFQLQALFAVLLSSGFVALAYRADMSEPRWTALAVAVWLLAMVGESASDRQLRQFRQDPANRGQICRHGLWRYSRHPNYFFECLHWFAYVPLAVGSAWWWLTLAPPAIMAFLLLKVSGIPPTEAHLTQSRPGYAEYARTTSALIPWFPKKR